MFGRERARSAFELSLSRFARASASLMHSTYFVHVCAAGVGWCGGGAVAVMRCYCFLVLACSCAYFYCFCRGAGVVTSSKTSFY